MLLMQVLLVLLAINFFGANCPRDMCLCVDALYRTFFLALLAVKLCKVVLTHDLCKWIAVVLGGWFLVQILLWR